MKFFIVFFIFFASTLILPSHISAQSTNTRSSVKDTIPIEDHDFHLTKDQFLYYYGTDDTAKAIIYMFYRKRGIGILDFAVYPLLASFVGDAAIAAGIAFAFTSNSGSLALAVAGAVVSVVGFYGIPIYYLVQRSNYSRQKLIYVLLNRERGMGIPLSVLDNLRDSDFQ